MGLSGGRGTGVPGGMDVKRYYQQMNRFAAAFALLADVAMVVMGGTSLMGGEGSLGGTLVGESKTYNHILSAALRYKWSVDAPPATPRIVK